MRIVLAIITALLTLTGCFAPTPEEARDDERWTKAVIEAITPLAHVKKLHGVEYHLMGVFSSYSASIDGQVISDSEDPHTNRELLDQVGRAIVTALKDHPSESSWITTEVVSPAGRHYSFEETLGLTEGPQGLESFADRYGVTRPRRR